MPKINDRAKRLHIIFNHVFGRVICGYTVIAVFENKIQCPDLLYIGIAWKLFRHEANI